MHVVNALRVLCITTLLLNCFLIIAYVIFTSSDFFYSQNSVEEAKLL